jgi:hypothetical protein
VSVLVRTECPKSQEYANRGKQTGSVSIRYRIHIDLTNDDNYSTIDYITGNSVVITAEESIMNSGMEFDYEQLPDKKFNVSIPKQKACRWVDDNAGLICEEYLKPNYIKDFPENWVIPYHYFLKGGSFDLKYASIKTAKLIANLHGRQLFFFKDAFYMADLADFMKYREDSIRNHYKREISKIGSLPLINIRSSKTLRLHNHLVNFPSKILKFIHINNQAVFQLDLRTSQFLLFANILNIYINTGESGLNGLFKKVQTKNYLRRLIKVLKEHDDLLPKIGVDINNQNSGKNSSSDVIRFITDVFFNDFYEIVQKHLNLPDRGLAKQILFKLLFRRGNKADILINKLKDHYPTIMSIISGFKQLDEGEKLNEYCKRNDISNFSVFLQCTEAEIFVDNIFKPLRNEGIPCFTRHDSIVVATGYEVGVELYAKAVFAGFGFKYNHKVEDKFWEDIDYLELEDSGYIDYLADESELSNDFINENTDEFELDTEKNNYMDEQQLQTCLRLIEIGYQDDYYEHLNIELLEEIATLPLLVEDKNILFDEIINLQNGYAFLQNKTNELLRLLLSRIETMKLPDNI